MPVSTVSRRVLVLKDQPGVALLQRTTRKLSLTVQGRAYLDQCGEPLALLYDAECALTQAQKQPEGLLRISVPVVSGRAFQSASAFVYRGHGVGLHALGVLRREDRQR